MSLYDRYQQSNSSVIPQFEGSAGEDFVKVGEYKQGQYDVAKQGADQIGDTAANMNVSGSGLAGVDAAAQDLRDSTQKKLDELSAAGNYEDAIPTVQSMGRNFANRSQEIMAPIQAKAAFQQKLEDKDLKLTPGTKSALMGMATDAFNKAGGLQKNARGQYQHPGFGMDAAANVDVPKLVNTIMEGIKDSKQATSVEYDGNGGMTLIKADHSREYITPQKVQETIQAGLANSSEYQAYKQQEQNISGWKASKYGIDDVSDTNEDGTNNQIKDAANAYATRHGLPFGEGYRAVASELKGRELDHNAMMQAMSRSHMDSNDKSSNTMSSMGLETFKHNLAQQDKDGANVPFILKGPNAQLTDNEQNIEKLRTTQDSNNQQLGDINSQIAGLTRKLSNQGLAPKDKTQFQSDLINLTNKKAALQDVVNGNEALMNYSKDQTARQMGYDDYQDFQSRNNGYQKDAFIKAGFSGGMVTKSGRNISLDEMADAAREKRIKMTFDGTSEGPSGAIMTLKDGTQVPMDAGTARNLTGAIASNMDNGKDKSTEFESRLKDTQKNIKNFSVQSNSVQMTKEQKEQLGEQLRGEKDNIKFTQPGSIDPVTAPDNFRVVSYNTASVEGNDKVKVEELDKDNKPTGKYYDASVGGSNVGDIMAKTYGGSKDASARAVADWITPGSGARQLLGKIPGQSIDVPEQQITVGKNADGTEKTVAADGVKIIQHPDQSISYNLTDKDGNVLKTADNVQAAGLWLDRLSGRDTYTFGTNKEVIDKKRTKTLK